MLHGQLFKTLLAIFFTLVTGSCYAYLSQLSFWKAVENPFGQVSVGEGVSCVVYNSSLKCWGRNEVGQCGGNEGGSPPNRLNQRQVFNLNDRVTKIAAQSTHHVCAIKNGRATCWGANSHGRLGSRSVGFSYTYEGTVTGLSSGVSDIALGGAHSCAVHNGAAKCWGYNGSGELGIGSADTDDNVTPLDVIGLSSGVTAIAATVASTCAIHNGAVKCWGFGGQGNNGDGTLQNSLTPVNVIGLGSGVTAISGSGAFSGGADSSSFLCAIQNGGVKCWGDNGYGQLGDGTTGGDRHTPVSVIGLSSNVSAITSAAGTSCAIHNGAAKCWGKNDLGQLGVGNTTNYSTPQQVVGLTSGVTSISTSGFHTCAVHNGWLKCWGRNNYGQLGIGTTSGSSVPVPIIP